ncbi:hypothetical protein C2G38_2175155 [Gigaspora rosea]|uniref:Uncharacterized protein n=1 Tax=Gigaspora rosea TaxID=44941 RepID=A0A397VPY1_9GLOM|nr:hypothetical protein C2G38_2175155 [Gigaspora rosea]
MSADIEDNDSYTFEFTRIITEIKNKIAIDDLMDNATKEEFDNIFILILMSDLP